jgi:hypothetical protein
MVLHLHDLIHLFPNPNHGDLAPLKQFGIIHVHRPTHAPPAAASVNQGVYISGGMRHLFSMAHSNEKEPSVLDGFILLFILGSNFGGVGP